MIQEPLRDLRADAVAQFEATIDFNTAVDLAFQKLGEHVRQMPPGQFYKAAYPVELTYKHKVSRVHPLINDGYLEKAHRGFAQELLLQHQVALFEHTIFDALRLLFLDRPQRLPKDKQIKYEVVFEARDLDDLLFELVEREVHDLSYKSPREWLQRIQSHVTKARVPPEDVDALTEIKASRDLLVHNRGVVNDIYLAKTGSKARGNIGDRISVDPPYVYTSWVLLSRTCLSILDALIEAEGASEEAATV